MRRPRGGPSGPPNVYSRCCAIFFGGAHFAYPAATIPLVPAWLPPSQAFWAYATGLFHIAAGVAVLIGVRARLATDVCLP